MPVNPVHIYDPERQSIDIRLYFDASLDPRELLDKISDTLQNAPDLCEMSGAYQLVSDGFGHSQPDDRPLA